MAIQCPIRLRPLSEAQFKEIDYQVMRHVFASQNELGRLCDELVYKNDLAARLVGAGMGTIHREVPVTISHREFRKPYSLDLVVCETVIYELKAAAILTGNHEKQLLNYLLLLGGSHGKLVNFRSASVEHRTVNAVLSPKEQRRYQLDSERWRELDPRSTLLREILIELLDAWGVFLELCLYQEALTFFLGGEHAVIRPVALTRSGLPLGFQPVHHLTDTIGFKVTAFKEAAEHGEAHVRRLFALTPLRALHWINLANHRIELVTFEK